MNATKLRRHLPICLLALSFVASACGVGTTDAVAGGEPTSTTESVSVDMIDNDDSSLDQGDVAEETVSGTDADDSVTADTDASAGDVEPTPDTNADNDDAAIQVLDNPAEEEIRNFFNAEGPSYGWDDDQTVCVADAVVATGATNPGELSDDEYWDAVTGCDGIRGLLGFLFPLVLNDPAGTCAAEAMTDEEIERIGYDALVDASDADTLAAAQAAIDLYPECTS